MTTKRDKRRTRRGRRSALGLPQTLSELFSIPLILFVMSNPTFGLKDLHLSPLFGPSPDKTHTVVDSVVPLQVQILADDQILLAGEEIPVEQLVSRLQASVLADQSIRLFVDKDANAGVFIRTQSELSKAGLWSRVRIPHERKQEGSP